MANKKKLGRQTLAVFLAVIMSLSLLQVTAFAVEEPFSSESQIVAGVETGDTPATTSYYNADGTQASNSNYDVAVKKTVMGTDTENVFNIQLLVTTKENLSQLNLAPDAAVVVVLDTSKSMQWAVDGNGYNYRVESDGYGQPVADADSNVANYDHDSGNYTYGMTPDGSGGYSNDTRINAAASAINSFADAYASVGTVDNDPVRMLSLVTFNSTAVQQQSWVDVSNDSTGYENNLSSFKKAVSDQNDITPSESDGKITFTTTHLASGTNLGAGLTEAARLLGEDDVSSIENKYVILVTDGEPNNPSPIATAKSNAITAANAVKSSAELFAIGFGTDSPNTWLQNSIASDSSHFFAATTGGLDSAFTTIQQTIKTKAIPWTVTDEMGDHISYVESVPVTGVTNESDYDTATNTLTWNLSQSGAAVSAATAGTNTYEFDYQIRLNTAFDGFDPSATYATNNSAVLHYVVLNETTNAITEADAAFTSPTVKGLSGSLTFSKAAYSTGDSGSLVTSAQNGAGFTLTCGDWSETATSQTVSSNNGVVTFNNIPSGNTFTLTETTVPDGYTPVYASYQVQVSQGTASLLDPASTAPITTIYDTETTSFTATKSWNDSGCTGVTLPPSVRVTLAATGVTLPDAIDLVQTLNSGNLWTYTWTDLPKYMAAGTPVSYSVTETSVADYTAAYTTHPAMNVTAFKDNIYSSCNDLHIPISSSTFVVIKATSSDGNLKDTVWTAMELTPSQQREFIQKFNSLPGEFNSLQFHENPRIFPKLTLFSGPAPILIRLPLLTTANSKNSSLMRKAAGLRPASVPLLCLVPPLPTPILPARSRSPRT